MGENTSDAPKTSPRRIPVGSVAEPGAGLLRGCIAGEPHFPRWDLLLGRRDGIHLCFRQCPGRPPCGRTGCRSLVGGRGWCAHPPSSSAPLPAVRPSREALIEILLSSRSIPAPPPADADGQAERRRRPRRPSPCGACPPPQWLPPSPLEGGRVFSSPFSPSSSLLRRDRLPLPPRSPTRWPRLVTTSPMS